MSNLKSEFALLKFKDLGTFSKDIISYRYSPILRPVRKEETRFTISNIFSMVDRIKKTLSIIYTAYFISITHTEKYVRLIRTNMIPAKQTAPVY